MVKPVQVTILAERGDRSRPGGTSSALPERQTAVFELTVRWQSGVRVLANEKAGGGSAQMLEKLLPEPAPPWTTVYQTLINFNFTWGFRLNIPPYYLKFLNLFLYFKNTFLNFK